MVQHSRNLITSPTLISAKRRSANAHQPALVSLRGFQIGVMDSKKTASTSSNFFSPARLLKKGWNGVTSPITAMKESMYGPSTTTEASSNSQSKISTTDHSLPSGIYTGVPLDMPSLFDVRSIPGPKKGIGIQPADNGPLASETVATCSSNGSSRNDPAQSSRTNSRTSTRTGSRVASIPYLDMDVANMTEEERAEAALDICHHNLYSVLTNPKVSSIIRCFV